MKTYLAKYKRICYFEAEVEASSEQAAINKVKRYECDEVEMDSYNGNEEIEVEEIDEE